MRTALCAAAVYALVPLGTRVEFSDGTPKPPAHHVKKLRAWESRNGSGVLKEKAASPPYASGYKGTPHFSLNTANYDAGIVRVMTVNVIFDLNSERAFRVADDVTLAPAWPGLVRSEHAAIWREDATYQLIAPYPGSNDGLVALRKADRATVEIPGTHGAAFREQCGAGLDTARLDAMFATLYPQSLADYMAEADISTEVTGREPIPAKLGMLARAHGLTPVQARAVATTLANG